MKFEETVSHLLSRVATAHKAHLEKRLAGVGLHGGQLSVLFELWRRDGRRQVDLAREIGLATPTVNKILNGMIEVGLVDRTRLEDDARATRIYLTDEGHAIRSRVEEVWLEVEEELLSEFTETERYILFDLLTKVRNYYFGIDPEQTNE